MIVRGMRGLGDNIYQRGFVRRLATPLWLDTPWPELYADLPGVQFLRPDTRLRTQRKNVNRTATAWTPLPRGQRVLEIGYGHSDMQRGSVVDAMARKCRVQDPVFDLPKFDPPDLGLVSRYAVIRPVTSRAEWLNTARSPAPEYVARAAAELMRRGYTVVSVADLQAGAEWIEGEEPPADLRLHGGELAVEHLLGLVRGASVVVGGVGWALPASIAAGVPIFTVLGGNLGHNAPDRLVCPRRMDLSRVGWAWPNSPCRCAKKEHNCEKDIDGFDHQLSVWLDGQGLYDGSDG